MSNYTAITSHATAGGTQDQARTRAGSGRDEAGTRAGQGRDQGRTRPGPGQDHAGTRPGPGRNQGRTTKHKHTSGYCQNLLKLHVSQNRALIKAKSWDS